MYYLNPLPAVRVWDSIEMDEKLSRALSAREFLSSLHSYGFNLLEDNSETIDLFQNDTMVSAVEELVAQHPKSILFQERTARVVDIQALLKEIR